MPLKDAIARKEYHKRYNKEWYLKNRADKLAKNQKWVGDNKERHRMACRTNAQRLKTEVLTHYAVTTDSGCGGTPRCNCCGEWYEELLTLHHINGDGAAHRRELNGQNIYAWAKRNNFPAMFSVLCFNCNSAVGHFSFCPHQQYNDPRFKETHGSFLHDRTE